MAAPLGQQKMFVGSNQGGEVRHVCGWRFRMISRKVQILPQSPGPWASKLENNEEGVYGLFSQ